MDSSVVIDDAYLVATRYRYAVLKGNTKVKYGVDHYLDLFLPCSTFQWK